MARRALFIVRMWLGLEPQPLRIPWEDLPVTLRYHERRYEPRRDVAAIEVPRHSLTKPGRYVGLGSRIIFERRRKPR